MLEPSLLQRPQGAPPEPRALGAELVWSSGALDNKSRARGTIMNAAFISSATLHLLRCVFL